MGQGRLSVREIREALRLKAEGFGDRQIAAVVASARPTVQECLCRCRKAGIVWPLPTDLDQPTLHARLYQRSVPLIRTLQPDSAYPHAEFKRRCVRVLRGSLASHGNFDDDRLYATVIVPA